jgi:hypothetical protein
MRKHLIGLGGRARSGKDTAAEHIHMQYLMNRYAFADPLKRMLESVFGDRFETGDREMPIEWLGKSPRQLMQTLGTEWGQGMVRTDLWVLLADREWQETRDSLANGLVISDVRFDHEAQWILDHGGHLIKILRPMDAAVNSHRSELGFDPAMPHYLVHNDGSLNDLYQALDQVLAHIEVPHCGH